MRVLFSLTLVASAATFQANMHLRPNILTARSGAAPAMQFWKKNDDSAGGKAVKGDFYDDEQDTTNKAGQFAWWSAEQSVDDRGNLNDLDRAGFSEDGKDLATDGLLLYAAFLPFLIWFLSYIFGGFSFGYNSGNF